MRSIAICSIAAAFCLFLSIDCAAAVFDQGGQPLNQQGTVNTDHGRDSSISQGRQFDELLNAATVEHQVGKYIDAAVLQKEALQIAKRLGDRARIAAALGALGNTYIALGPRDKALQLLLKAEVFAREVGNPVLEASIAINLGNYYAFEKTFEPAQTYFERGITAARTGGDAVLVAQAQSNLSRIALDQRDFSLSKTRLDNARNSVNRLASSTERAYIQVNLALSYMRLRQESGKFSGLRHISYSLLNSAEKYFESKNDTKGSAYAIGYLGELYEHAGRYDEALEVTQRAIFKAQQLDDQNLLYRWLWQKGRLLAAMDDRTNAISAYRQATAILDGLRYQLSSGYTSQDSSFRESVSPIYVQFISLLFDESTAPQYKGKQQEILSEVRDTVEKLKAAEIRDYYRDDCVDALRTKAKPLWKASSSALIVYPIIMADQMELLLDFPDGTMERRTVNVNRSQLSKQVKRFRRLLEKRATNEYRRPARMLYHWLITPLLSVLENSTIDTLVFVPDGPLLTIPIAALYDGEQHLIEKYAVAVTPGVQLIDPKTLQSTQIQPLLGGLSRSVEGYPALTYVEQELQSIHQRFGGQLLLNKAFHRNGLEQTLNEGKLNVLHISTHAVLGSEIDKSFLITYDGRLSINQLADYIGLFKFRDNPLELLVLSACETAQGDARAALGLTGIAVKAGARSALGTLWKVNDSAASALMIKFYHQLEQNNVSRAIALRSAQNSLIADLRYRHPAYWAAFLLINNWL